MPKPRIREVTEKDRMWTYRSSRDQQGWQINWCMYGPSPLPVVEANERIEALIDAYERQFHDSIFHLTRLSALKHFIVVKHKVKRADFDKAFLHWAMTHRVFFYTDGFGHPGPFRLPIDPNYMEDAATRLWNRFGGKV